jgi:hypothetical protein
MAFPSDRETGMKVTPRYLVQLSSAEIAFLHVLVQRQLRGFVAERPEGRGLDPAEAPPELVALDRRLLARWQEIAQDEEGYFGGQGRRPPEAMWIAEEHAALAGAAAARGALSALPVFVPKALALAAGGRKAGNVVSLHGTGRRPSAASAG